MGGSVGSTGKLGSGVGPGVEPGFGDATGLGADDGLGATGRLGVDVPETRGAAFAPVWLLNAVMLGRAGSSQKVVMPSPSNRTIRNRKIPPHLLPLVHPRAGRKAIRKEQQSRTNRWRRCSARVTAA